VQLKGHLVQCGDSRDRITIHKDVDSFVAQFAIDVPDETNRPATVLCYGRMPRATSTDAIRRGLHLLRDFLASQGIPWTTSIRERYLVVCHELAKASEAGFRFPKLRMPGFLAPTGTAKATEDDRAVRRGSGASPETTGASFSTGQEAGSSRARPESEANVKGKGMTSDQSQLLSPGEVAKSSEPQEQMTPISAEVGHRERGDDDQITSGESNPPSDEKPTSSPGQEGQ
jgi:hypothetical protein